MTRLRYIVNFTIKGESVSKFFNEEDHAKDFSKMVDGEITSFSSTDYSGSYTQDRSRHNKKGNK